MLCMVVHAYYPLNEPRVQREAAAARELGFEVTVLALRGQGEARSETIEGVDVRRVSLSHKRGAGIRRMAFEYLAFTVMATCWLGWHSLRSPFEIVHFHNPPDFLIVAGLFPRVRRSRLVLDIHDLSSHMFGVRVSGLLGRFATRMLIWIERCACRTADEVITVHEPYRRELTSHGVPARKIHVVMNSLDEAVLARAQAIVPAQRPAHTFTLGYHGTLTWWYGVDLMIEAVSRLRYGDGIDAEALVVGDGDALPTLRARVEALRLGDQVRLTGRYLPIENALAAVAECDCGVIPNRPSELNRFALSSKLFEYVALGIPVVVSRLETLSAYFDSDEVTFFEPGDVASLTVALRWVYEHPDLAAKKAQRARLRASAYSWSGGKEELGRLYRSLHTRSAQAQERSRRLTSKSRTLSASGPIDEKAHDRQLSPDQPRFG
jgi:glycosyltransferase involved in cell wall biosynthesis